MQCSAKKGAGGSDFGGEKGQHLRRRSLAERLWVGAGFGIALALNQCRAGGAASSGVVQRRLARSGAELARYVGVSRGSVNVSAPIEASGRRSTSARDVVGRGVSVVGPSGPARVRCLASA